VKLLFDVHVAKAAVAAFRKIAPQIQAEHIVHWHNGTFLQADDNEILAACRAENRVLVTYDMATIPDLLRRWISEERPHSGVFFADENTIRPNNPGEVAAAVAALAKEIGNADTTNLVRFLRLAG
jgi:predicted nuclease of predicted toxin-antitoxin system